MKRIDIQARNDWQKKVEEVGFVFHSLVDIGTPYWNEEAAFVFNIEEVNAIETATNVIHEMAILAVDSVIEKGDCQKLGLTERQARLVENSWNNPKFDEISLYGRLDLGYDGHNIKLLEYNADTPTSLLEAAVVQWYWMKDVFPKMDQFNSLHEKLIKRWGAFKKQSPKITFSCMRDSAEDYATVHYLADCATQAGIKTEFLYLDQIGLDNQRYTNMNEETIHSLFKLYPLEWLTVEKHSEQIESFRIIEPAWKMLLSNKAILPILWEMFPKNPYLLPAYFEQKTQNCVKKPFFSREGANISIIENGKVVLKTDGVYNDCPVIYQDKFNIPTHGGRYPVIGSWIVGEEACGMGIREDFSEITGNLSRFVPHIIS